MSRSFNWQPVTPTPAGPAFSLTLARAIAAALGDVDMDLNGVILDETWIPMLRAVAVVNSHCSQEAMTMVVGLEHHGEIELTVAQ